MGHVGQDSDFGKAIAATVGQYFIKTICEVGAWNGEGTTACIYDGFRGDKKQLYSIEGDPEMYAQAARKWNGVPGVQLMHGTLHRNIMSRDEVLAHPLFPKIRNHYNIWYDTEERACKTAPIVQVPKCDCILLDGGEFSTQGDWNVLSHPDLKAVILDDVSVIKTSGIYAMLSASNDWVCTFISYERNGSAIFRKKNIPTYSRVFRLPYNV
jgi:hypothetical protein